MRYTSKLSMAAMPCNPSVIFQKRAVGVYYLEMLFSQNLSCGHYDDIIFGEGALSKSKKECFLTYASHVSEGAKNFDWY